MTQNKIEVQDFSYEDIVTNFDSPTLVLAGPGAGKSYLLSDRVVRLLNKGVDKEIITVVTFGKDASLNMKDGLLAKKGDWRLEYGKLPRISTLHSLGLSIVKESPGAVGLRKSGLAVQHDEFIKKLLFRDAAYLANQKPNMAVSSIKCKAFGNCKQNDSDDKCLICKKYWKIMSKCDRIDFDDQVLLACRILEKTPEVLEKFQTSSTHLLVDEYQDINASQHRLIEILSKRNPSGLFAVGDDAQSIYGFRGASPKYILNFESYYPEADTPPLKHSRRCHEKIIRNAEKVLIENYKDWLGPFELTFHREIDDAPYVWQVPSEKAEANRVAGLVEKYLGEEMDILILSPKKEIFTEVSEKLSERGIPHSCPLNLLPKHTERRLNAINNISEWVKKPDDNFKARLAIEILLNGDEVKVPGGGSKKIKESTRTRRENIEKEIGKLWETVNRKDGLYKILCGITEPSIDLSKIREKLNILVNTYNDTSKKGKAEFLRQVALATGSWSKAEHLSKDISEVLKITNNNEKSGGNNVRLMTMRKAKGLQADVTIMIGLEDDIIPNPIANVEEEARIFYVSMTRAKKKLYMIHSFQRPRNVSFGPQMRKKLRSRFLEALNIKSEYIK